MRAMELKHYYRIDEVAREFSVSRRTIYRLIAKGELSAIKLGHGRRISVEELQRVKKKEPYGRI